MAVNKANSLFQHYVTQELAISAAVTYTAGDAVGGLLTLTGSVEGDADQTGPVGGLIQSVVITDADAESAELIVTFFDENPTATTVTDNAALTIADADLTKVIGTVTVQTAEYVAYADNSVGQALQLAIPFVLPSGNALYAAVHTTGTPEYTATTDLTLRVGVLKG